jgi:transaldolase
LSCAAHRINREGQQSRGRHQEDDSQNRQQHVQRIDLDEKKFRWMLNENAMATDKLSEGIRLFNADAKKLEQYIARML